MLQRGVEPPVDYAQQEALGAVAAHAARPPLPGRRHRVGAAPAHRHRVGAAPAPGHRVAARAELVVAEVGVRAAARPEDAEHAGLAAPPRAEGVGGQGGQQGVQRQGGEGRLWWWGMRIWEDTKSEAADV